MNKEKRMQKRANRKPRPVEFKYYFYRDDNHVPRITVCLAKDASGTISRGISICCADDVVSKEEGKKWARKRALKAHYSERASDTIKRSFPFRIEHPFVNKSEYRADLTEYEMALFREKKV